MKGCCLKCGCTAQRPCWHPDGARPCGWIDDQEDFCDRCAGAILCLPIEMGEVQDPAILIRCLRAALFQNAARLAHLEQLFFSMAGVEHIELPASPIWTPDRE